MIKINKKKFQIAAPFLLIFIMMIVLHFIAVPGLNDDKWFASILNDKSLQEYWIWRYNTWSSRLIIETILIFFTKYSFFLWRIADSMVIVLLVYSISRIFLEKSNYKYDIWILIGLILLYPFYQMSSAGWVATTLNYLWPLSFGLFSFIPIKKQLNNEKMSIIEKIFYALALVFACNTEQMGAIIFGFYLIYSIYLIKNKQYTKENFAYILFCMLLSIVSLFYILTCPGNENRFIAELHWLPEFTAYSFWDKILAGFISTTSYFFYKFRLLYFLLCCLLSVCSFIKYKEIPKRIFGSFPLSIYTICTVGKKILLVFFPSFASNDPATYIFQVPSFTSFSLKIFCIINLVICVLLLLELFFIFDKEKAIGLSLILMAGGASRIIMGFSPTLYASEYRTYIYLYFSIIIICLLLLDFILDNTSKIRKKYISVFFFSLGMVAYLFTIYNIV